MINKRMSSFITVHSYNIIVNTKEKNCQDSTAASVVGGFLFLV